MDGLGILPLEKAWMNVIGRPEGAKGFQNVEAGVQKAAEMYPVLNQMAYFNGKTVQLAVLRKLVGAGVTALGGSGPIARVIQGMVTFGGTEAIQNLSDFVAGKMTPERYWTSVEHGVRTGGVLAGLMELIPAAKRDFMDRFSQRKAGKGGSTALVPATSAPELPSGAGTSAGTSLMPQTGAPANSLINIQNRDIVAIAGALQERGVGARDAILTAIDLAEIKRKAGENALTMTEKAFDEAFEKGFNYDIMEEIRETYSDELKEELKSGRAREESKEEFIQRANAEGYTTYEGKKGTYGFRRAGDLRWGDRATARYYYEAQREFRELGLDITFIDGEV